MWLISDNLTLVSLRNLRILRTKAPAVLIDEVLVVVGKADLLVVFAAHGSNLGVKPDTVGGMSEVDLRILPLFIVFLGNVERW